MGKQTKGDGRPLRRAAAGHKRRVAISIDQRLARSQIELRAVLDAAADGILSIDRHGVVQSANQSAEHTFGVSSGMLAGRRLDQLVIGFDAARLVTLLGPGGGMHVARLEAQGLRASGDRFPLALSLSEFVLQGEVNYSLMARDISDEKMAEAVLQLRLRAIEAAHHGIVIADMMLPGQPIIYANPAFTRITGYGADDIIGRNCKVLLGPERSQPESALLAAAVAQGRSCEVLIRNYRLDGSLFWNELSISPVRDAEGRVTHYVGSQCDVSDRVRAAEDLRIRSKRLDAIFTLSPDGLVAFDSNGSLSNVNPAFLWMSGCAAEQLLGLSVPQFDTLLAGLCDPARPYSALQHSIDHDRPGHAASCTLYLAQPSHCILLRSVRSDDAGSPERVVYFRDVTHETEVDRIKSEFLSTAAHELRTPMASIFGFSELLLRRSYDEATQRELFGTINRQAQVLINLINELLDLARIEARAGQDFNFVKQPLAAVIDGALSALLVPNDTRKVEVRLPRSLPQVVVDAQKFAQALTNVLINAYKYSPHGGAIELFIEREGGAVGVGVRDHGLGLAPAHLTRLFERFFRADPSGNIPGTGLGMCIVKEVVELHGGRVAVQSALGQGTTVILWLPVAA